MEVLCLCFPASMWPRVVKSKLWVGWSRRFLPDLSFHNLKQTHVPLSKMGFTSKWMPRKGNLPALGPLFPKWRNLVPFGVCVLCPVWLSVTPWTVALQAPLSMGFSKEEYWSGWPFPPPGDLPDPGIEPVSPASLALAGRFVFFFLFFLTLCHLGSRCLFDQVNYVNPLIPLCLEGTALSGCSMGGLLWARSLRLVNATLAGAQNGRYSSALRPQGYN